MRNAFGAAVVFFAILLVMILHIPLCAAGEDARERKRIAYFEVGPYWIFRHEYKAFREEMEKSERYVAEYPPELHMSPGWDASPEELAAVALGLQERDDVDLILLAGTAAARAALQTNLGRIPMIGMDLTDPVGSGLVASADDTGVDNFTCDILTDRWKQMFGVFHEVIGFSKLGIIYSTTAEGRVAPLLGEAEKLGEEKGFSLLPFKLQGEKVEDCAAGIKRLHEEGADAFIIGSLPCFDWEQNDPAPLYKLLNDKYRMPTFAWDGSYQVQGGALMGFTLWNFAREGAGNARKAMRIFDGESPRSLSMVKEFTPLLVLNLETAFKLNISVPFDILMAADEIYMESSRPEVR